MKYLLIALLLTACVEEKRTSSGLSSMRDLSVAHIEIFCYEGIKYIYVGHSATAKINSVTRNPESCYE